MESSQTLKRLRIVIVVLSVLLVISLAALSATLIHFSGLQDLATVEIPNNIITPESLSHEAEYGQALYRADQMHNAVVLTNTSETARPRSETTIELYKRHAEDNDPFQVTNMFPGDAETRYYRVRVSHSADVTVHYHATIRPGYEKLAEVMMIRIQLLTTGQTMYEGLMRDMPESVSHTLTASSSTTSELEYEITAYLDTRVGNDYQNKSLIADFSWWVDGDGGLTPPGTGDNSNVIIFRIAIAAFVSAAVIVLLYRRKKEAQKNER